MKRDLGDKTFDQMRRTWDHTVPGGESLRQVHERMLNCYSEHILPNLKVGKNVIVSVHAGVIRTLLKHLDQMEDNDEAARLTIGNGDVIVYKIDPSGAVINKQIRPSKIPL